MAKTTFTSPVMRFVQGSVDVAQDKDMQGNPRVIKSGPNAGQPNPQYFVAGAVAKTDPAWPAFWELLVRQAFAEPAVIRDVYAELKKLERDVPDVAAFAAPEGGTDWTAAAQDLDTVTRILQAWRAEERLREIQDDDEEWMLF